MNNSIIAQSEIIDNDNVENSIEFLGGEKFIATGCSDPRFNGHEMAEFWGRCFDVTYMKKRPRKRFDSDSKKSSKSSSSHSPHGYSNTVRAISQASTNVEDCRNCYVRVSNSETSPCDDFRVPETGTVEELLKLYDCGELRQGVQLYFSDLSDFETFNDENFGKRPKVADELGPLFHFRRPDILLNPIGPFLGFDWAQVRYFGTWDPGLWGAYMPWFGEAYLKHQRLREPIIFQYKPDSEKWSFRCAGWKERSRLGYPSEAELPYIYVLERGGLRIYLVPPELHKNPKIPAVILIVGGQEFRDLVSPTSVEREALSFLAQFGFQEFKELRDLSRIDIQITGDACGVSDFRRAYREGRTVCRARNVIDICKDGRSPSGNPEQGTMEFGSRRNRAGFLRVYDKRAELEETETKDRGQKFYYFYSCLGNRQIRENVKHWDQLTRVEFELHKKIFQQFDVKTLEDFERKMPSIVKYLTTDWFRVIELGKGNNHSSRIKTAKFWKDISETFMTVAEFFATQSGGSISVTRRTKEERVYLNPNWPKSVKTTVKELTRTVAELALVHGIEDVGQIDKKFIDLFVLPVLYRRLFNVRQYVATRGAGYLKSRGFLLHDSRDYYIRQ